MNRDGLLGIGDVIPVAVGFPAISDDLNENATERNIRNVGDALLIGLDADLGLLVLDAAFLVCLQVDAGVFDGFVGVATCDFDREAIARSGSRVFWRRRRTLLSSKRKGGCQCDEQSEGNEYRTVGSHWCLLHRPRKQEKRQEVGELQRELAGRETRGGFDSRWRLLHLRCILG